MNAVNRFERGRMPTMRYGVVDVALSIGVAADPVSTVTGTCFLEAARLLICYTPQVTYTRTKKSSRDWVRAHTIV